MSSESLLLQSSADGLAVGGVPLAQVAAAHGTPTYVYSCEAILQAHAAYARALEPAGGLVCYAVKANPSLAILSVLARAGCGFDIVSGGELARVLAAGGDPAKIVFSGVGKTVGEMRAGLDAGIGCFNVESAPELEVLDRVARDMGRRAPVSVRVNPDVDPGTHPYISTGLRQNKFGVGPQEAFELTLRAAASPGLAVRGIDCHIGSQITQAAPYLEAAERMLDLVDRIEGAGVVLHHIDFGGGLGIRYCPEDAAAPGAGELVGQLLDCLRRRGHGAKRLVLEPGRSIVGAAGALLTRVLYLKDGADRRFAIVDAAMNDLLRPSLYEAWMDVREVRPEGRPSALYDVVGPVCESGDWLARARELAIGAGDLLAIDGAGAYGMSMASNYNSRGRAAEVMVAGGVAHLVRPRENPAELFAGECRLPDGAA
jgi:diaminopimelate decarboxylase